MPISCELNYAVDVEVPSNDAVKCTDFSGKVLQSDPTCHALCPALKLFESAITAQGLSSRTWSN